jgi:pimeloyl-ACP methyl ester carboxylesterase
MRPGLFLFCPGMEGRGTLFHRQAQRLTDYDVRIVAYDSAAPQTFELFAEQALRVAREYRAANPTAPRGVLCGFSLGACTAIEVALREPEHFAALVLINPATAFARTGAAGLAAWFMRHAPPELVRIGSDLTLGWNANLSRFKPDDINELRRVSRSPPTHDISRRLESLARFDSSSERLRKIQLPVLLIASEHDHVQPSVAETQRLRGVWPQARSVLLKGSGHECLQEEGFDLSADLNAWRSTLLNVP